ncbi:circularly permuted type 2 ATP-grasp protein [Roseibium salinum]|nr:circularly permuted type 2 ATP-grasp protein [Roseibium salinum]
MKNRVATGRVFNEFFAKAHVHRLAGFFRRFRDHFVELRGESDSRVSILTPGPMNDTYFEHAYIARYLGFMLLEGEDLTVRDGRLMVRTVSGLKPVSVLWRRLDAAWTDPLEMNETSRLGTPGLVQAVRHGSVTMVNALGTGILETRALLAFLPRISKHLLGEKLKLPNVATWWCGEAATRQYVKEHAETMMFSPALSTALPFASAQTDFLGKDFEKVPQGDSGKLDRQQGRRSRRPGSRHPFRPHRPIRTDSSFRAR